MAEEQPAVDLAPLFDHTIRLPLVHLLALAYTLWPVEILGEAGYAALDARIRDLATEV